MTKLRDRKLQVVTNIITCVVDTYDDREGLVGALPEKDLKWVSLTLRVGQLQPLALSSRENSLTNSR